MDKIGKATYTKQPDGRWEWRVWITHDDGTRKHPKRVFNRKGEAEEHDRGERAKAKGTAPENCTVADKMRAFLAERIVREGTRDVHRSFLRNHIEGYPIGAMPWLDVDTPDVRAWAVQLTARPLKPAGVRKCLTMLRAMYASAITDCKGRDISFNPVLPERDMKFLPAVEKNEVVPLTVEQVRAWAAAVQCEPGARRDYSGDKPAGGKRRALRASRFCEICYANIDHLRWDAKFCGSAHRNAAYRARRGANTAARQVPRTLRPVRAMILTQAGLGLRIGELKALREKDVDFDKREVRVEFQFTRRRVPVRPKTENSCTTVPLPDSVARVLKEQIRDFPPRADGVIFRQPGGQLWNEATQWEEYHRAAVAAGLPEGTSSHDLRHHYASVLIKAGHSIPEVAARIRDTQEMVMSTYGHLFPGQEYRTREAIDALWKEEEVPAA